MVKLSVKEKRIRTVALTLNRVWVAGFVSDEKRFHIFCSDLLRSLQFPARRKPKEASDDKAR
jgi:hypothetical protein